MDDRKLKHLELIQGVINRLAGNSFLKLERRFGMKSSRPLLRPRRRPHRKQTSHRKINNGH
jgi:hypothetical protein